MAQAQVITSRAPHSSPERAPGLSIVVTLYNEAEHVDELYARTVAALEPRSFELVFVDDGSTDDTFARVERLHERDHRVRAVRFKRNFGQHLAMHAGLARSRGDIVVTMDGDLQNQPEDILRLVATVEAGTDVASGRRSNRTDPWSRTVSSRLINGMLRRLTRVDISDFGCAFNAYRRSAIEPMFGAIGKQKFTKALVLSGGASWPRPIQWIGIALGMLCTLLATGLGVYGVGYWIDTGNFPGPLLGGVAVLFVLGIQGFIMALIGEYLARIQRDVEGRPVYVLDRELG
jgi:undecaprenyl-phosphate 4-deoxy-4-formamido-L-arabinose transferase